MSHHSHSTPTQHTQPLAAVSVLSLRLPQDFASVPQSRQVNLTIPVGKPPKHSFFRTSQDRGLLLNLLDANKIGSEGFFVVTPEVSGLTAQFTRVYEMRWAVTMQGALYIIPVPQPDADGRINSWHQTLAIAVDEAQKRWIRLQANQPRGGYDVFEALNNHVQPQWPEETFEQLVEIAFRNRIISDDKHPLVQELLGA